MTIYFSECVDAIYTRVGQRVLEILFSTSSTSKKTQLWRAIFAKSEAVGVRCCSLIELTYLCLTEELTPVIKSLNSDST